MSTDRLLARFAVVLLLIGGVSVVFGAEQPKDRLTTSLESIAAQAQNATLKLRNDTIGFSAAKLDKAAETDSKTSPSRKCCASNIDVIAGEMKTVEVVLTDLHGRFKTDGNEQGQEILQLMARQYKVLNNNLSVFKGADTKEYAEAAIKSVAAANRDLIQLKDQLYKCCLPEAVLKNQQR